VSYQPGDIVNGHVLGTDNQWHPLPADATQAMAPGQPTQAMPGYQPQQPGYQPQQPGYQPQQPGYRPSQPGYQPGGMPQGGARPPAPPKPFYRRAWFWVMAVIGAVVLAAVVAVVAIGNAVKNKVDEVGRSVTVPTVVIPTVPVNPAPQTPAPTVAQPPASTPQGGDSSGKTATDGSLKFTVTNVDCTQHTIGKDPLSLTAKGTFCVVDVNVTNVGSSKVTWMALMEEAASTSGSKLSLEPAMVFLPTAKVSLDLAPGASGTNQLVFDSPDGGLSSVTVFGDVLSDGVKITL